MGQCVCACVCECLSSECAVCADFCAQHTTINRGRILTSGLLSNKNDESDHVHPHPPHGHAVRVWDEDEDEEEEEAVAVVLMRLFIARVRSFVRDELVVLVVLLQLVSFVRWLCAFACQRPHHQSQLTNKYLQVSAQKDIVVLSLGLSMNLNIKLGIRNQYSSTRMRGQTPSQLTNPPVS